MAWLGCPPCLHPVPLRSWDPARRDVRFPEGQSWRVVTVTKAAVTTPPEDKEGSGDRDVPGAALVVQVEVDTKGCRHVDTAPGTVWGPAAVMSGDAWPFSVCELAETPQISFRVFPPRPPSAKMLEQDDDVVAGRVMAPCRGTTQKSRQEGIQPGGAAQGTG